MALNIIVTRRAAWDVTNIGTYLQPRDPGGASRIASAIEASFHYLADFPYGAPETAVAGVREHAVPRTPYVILYRPTQTEVRILRVLHGAQWRP